MHINVNVDGNWQIWDLSCHPEDFSPKDLIPDKAGRFFASLRMTYGKF